MTSFFSKKYSSLTPYTPGEQPRGRQYIKLNTNESPFAPSENVVLATQKAAATLCLYSDPDCTALHEKLADIYGVRKNQVLAGNGSDEILNFAFMAFCDENRPAVFADITYGFYPVFAALNGVKYTEIPLNDDFTINVDDYINCGATVFIANPNAPTSLALGLNEIEAIVRSNPKNIVVIDEAYVDFGAQSAVGLIDKYDNLLVVGTFSKSRSLAGARLGFAIANEGLIGDLNTIKYSTNPYNVNSMTQAAGVAALENNGYYMANCRKIIENREYAKQELEKLGFTVLESKANFLFAKSDSINGEELYLKLKDSGILVRHFNKERIKDYVRITIGNREQMDRLIEQTAKIVKR